MKNQATLKNFGRLFSLTALNCLLLVTTVDAKETKVNFFAERSKKSLEDISQLRYKDFSSAWILGKRQGEEKWSLNTYCKEAVISEYRDCYYAINKLEGHDAEGKPIYFLSDMLHIRHKNNLKEFDTDDTNCQSTQFKGEFVLAFGSWKFRKDPKKGGYAHSLRAAWVIEKGSMVFREIQPASVTCQYDNDRD